MWSDAAVETWWRLKPAAVTPMHPTWPLDRSTLDQIVLRWPKHYDWGLAKTWLHPLLVGFDRYVKTERADLAQCFERINVTELVIEGSRFTVAFDYADSSSLNDDCLERCDIYFKMQYLREGYGDDRVLPGGYIARDIYPFLARIRRIRDRRSYVYDVYGRFSVNEAKARRGPAIAALEEQDRFRYEGGAKLAPYTRSLREAARAKVCIDLPGRGDFCFRLADYLAIGVCVVGPPHGTALHVPLVDGEQIAYTNPDYSDLVEVCERYVQDEAARDRLAANARAFFDRYLHRDQLAAYYLHSCLARLG
jgi:hypothetical protein